LKRKCNNSILYDNWFDKGGISGKAGKVERASCKVVKESGWRDSIIVSLKYNFNFCCWYKYVLLLKKKVRNFEEKRERKVNSTI